MAQGHKRATVNETVVDSIIIWGNEISNIFISSLWPLPGKARLGVLRVEFRYSTSNTPRIRRKVEKDYLTRVLGLLCSPCYKAKKKRTKILMLLYYSSEYPKADCTW